MSNLEKWNDKPVGREKAGLELVKVGGAGLGAMALAWALPFVTLPMVFIALVLGGIFFAL